MCFTTGVSVFTLKEELPLPNSFNNHLQNQTNDIAVKVCNAVYLRLNFSTPLCACPEEGDPCSASTLANDGHSLRNNFWDIKLDFFFFQIVANQPSQILPDYIVFIFHFFWLLLSFLNAY